MIYRFVFVGLSLALSILIGVVLAHPAGGATTTAGKRGPVIGLSLDTLKEQRWQRDRDLFVAAVEKRGGTVRVQSANSDDKIQVQNVESLLTAGVDCLVVVPHDGKAMAVAVGQAAKAGVPVIAYDRLIVDAPDLSLYVTFDPLHIGREQAQYLATAFKDRPHWRVVRVYGSPTDNNARLYKQGQDEVLAPLIAAGTVEVVHEDWAQDWRPENAKRILNAALAKAGAGGIDGVLASNDGTAGGAIQALREEGLLGKVLVTGQDAETAALARIAAGEQAMTIYKPLAKLADLAADLAVRLARRQVVVAPHTLANGAGDIPTAYVPITPVTAGNLVTTVIADGFATYDDVYAGVPADRRPAKP